MFRQDLSNRNRKIKQGKSYDVKKKNQRKVKKVYQLVCIQRTKELEWWIHRNWLILCLQRHRHNAKTTHQSEQFSPELTELTGQLEHLEDPSSSCVSWIRCLASFRIVFSYMPALPNGEWKFCGTLNSRTPRSTNKKLTTLELLYDPGQLILEKLMVFSKINFFNMTFTF